jgi:hypothetical protein
MSKKRAYEVPSIETMDKREFIMFLAYLNHLIHPILKDTLRLEEIADAFRNLIKAMIYSVDAIKEFAELTGRSVEDVRKNLEESTAFAIAILTKVYETVLGDILTISKSPKDFLMILISALHDIINEFVRDKYSNYAFEAEKILHAVSWMTGVVWKYMTHKLKKSEEEVIKMTRGKGGLTELFYKMLSEKFREEPWRTWSIQWTKDLL